MSGAGPVRGVRHFDRYEVAASIDEAAVVRRCGIQADSERQPHDDEGPRQGILEQATPDDRSIRGWIPGNTDRLDEAKDRIAVRSLTDRPGAECPRLDSNQGPADYEPAAPAGLATGAPAIRPEPSLRP